MQGDSKVDELMRPVNAAIDRHVKDRDAKVDIYNRAYEAVQNGMDYLANGTYCAYCGAEFPFDDHTATLVGEHIRTCEKHPMRDVEVRAKKAEAELTALRERTRWIPVEERLPLPAQKRDGYMSDSSELVHVYPSPKNDRAVCYLHYLEKWSCSAEVTPTHWRPIDLPDADKEGME